MKKIVSLVLVICMCLSVVTMFTACNNSAKDNGNTTTDEDENENENEETNGWLLPTKITDSRGEFELELTWDENSCTFSAENTTFSFVYDETKRSLGFYVDGKGETDYKYDDLCVFDAEDRINSIHFEGRTIMQLSYENEKMIVSLYGEDEPYAPKEMTADWDTRTIPMPPFDDPNDFLSFTEWGDLHAGKDHTLYDYEYDDKGNILSIQVPDLGLGDYSWSISYGDSAMTEAWQRTIVKFLLVYSLGQPWAVFAMNMMCFGAYQQHNGK